MDSRTTKLCVCLCAMALGVLVGSGEAYGSLVSFDLSVEFSGATPPAGAAPWLNATFDDGDSPGSVVLTLTTANLSGAEMVSMWMFNLDPDLNPADLIFSPPAKTGSFSNSVISTATDDFRAGGSGYFDIKIAFTTKGGVDNRFGVGDAAQYTITGIPSLTGASFDFLSFGDGEHGSLPTAAHVQSTGEDEEDSGWVTTPEPTSAILVLMGAVGLLMHRRRN